VFSTEGAKHGLDAVRKTYRCADITTERGEPSQHRYRATRYMVAGTVVGHDRTDSLTIHRAPRHLADGVDMYALLFHLRGQSVQGQTVIETGDFALQDFAEPNKANFSTIEAVSLFMPRKLLAPKLDIPDAGAVRRVRGDSSLAKLASQMLVGFYEALPNMTMAEANRALHPVIDLCAIAINGHVDSCGAKSAVRQGLGLRIRRFIESHLESPELSVGHIQKHFRCSRSLLYRVFPSAGGIVDYIRERRLNRAMHRLVNPGDTQLSVTEIAAQLGFASSTVFGRSFKRRFGITPREARTSSSSCLPIVEAERKRSLHDWFTAL